MKLSNEVKVRLARLEGWVKPKTESELTTLEILQILFQNHYLAFEGRVAVRGWRPWRMGGSRILDDWTANDAWAADINAHFGPSGCGYLVLLSQDQVKTALELLANEMIDYQSRCSGSEPKIGVKSWPSGPCGLWPESVWDADHLCEYLNCALTAWCENTGQPRPATQGEATEWLSHYHDHVVES